MVVFLICLGLHNSGFSNYLKTHTYQCRVVGGEKTEGGYKRSGHMYLILQEVNSNKIFSIDASPEDYHNKPGTILTYTFKEYFIAPNKTYDLYRSIFLTGISLLAGLLVTFPLLFGTIDISEEMASTLMIATLILLGTSILSYNFVI